MKAITLLFCISISVQAGAQAKSKNYPLVNFAELATTTGDTIRLKAFVLNVYECPPCPPGMICKPCLGNHVMVVEKRPVDIMKIPLEDRLRIFADQPKRMTAGKQYMFTVTYRNKKTSTNELQLISFAKR
jgi:hypothetical protein